MVPLAEPSSPCGVMLRVRAPPKKIAGSFQSTLRKKYANK
jgi:hypothetical protein